MEAGNHLQNVLQGLDDAIGRWRPHDGQVEITADQHVGAVDAVDRFVAPESELDQSNAESANA
jgi:hypothetical protein